MKTISVKHGPQDVPAIVLGCMRMPNLSVNQAARIIQTAVDHGINFF